MTVSRTLLCGVYLAIALLAVIATWHQNLTYFGGNFWDGNVHFWKDALATPAAVSITADLFLFGLAVVVWMVAEARRHGIGFVWIYVVVAAFVAISVAVPLFLVARERRLRSLRPEGDTVTFGRGDLIGTGLFALPCLILSLWSLLH